MTRQRLQNYYVFFLDEWHIPEPAYYFLDAVKGKDFKDALKRNLRHLINAARKILDLSRDEVTEYKFERALHIVRADSWLSSREVYWNASLPESQETLEN